MSIGPQDILQFWFESIDSKKWFIKDSTFDSLIQKKFGHLLLSASQGELWGWRKNIQGRLAEIIVLDQFSRNIHRDQPESFAQDAMALTLAQEAVASGKDVELPSVQKAFLYMPFMHSESLLIHQEAVRLFSQAGLKNNLDFELKHKKIIEEFGRYPHRNEILDRESTPQEIEFLKKPGSGF